MCRLLPVWFVLFVACPPIRAQELAPEETRQARKLYVAKCAKCHKLYDPAAYDDAEWDAWMKKMGKKSKLKKPQYDLLVRYLVTLRPATARDKTAPRPSP